MPNWKKVIVSGSAAVLSSVTSSFTGSLTGALIGTSSWATAATQAHTRRISIDSTAYIVVVDSDNASPTAEILYNPTNVTINPARGSLTATSVTASFTGSLIGALTGTASYASTASYSNTLGAELFSPAVGALHLRNSAGTSISTLANFYATSASAATTAATASYVVTALTASYVTGSIYTSANPVLSASYALTASHALNGGGGAAFPYVGTAVITGSLIVSGSGANGGIDTSGMNPSLLASDGTATVSFGINKLWLNEAGGNTTVDWGNKLLYDSAAGLSVDWESRGLNDTSAVTSVDWENRRLLDATATRAMDYNSRVLIYPDGTSTALNYGTQNQITMSGSVLVTGSLTVSGSSTFTNIGPAVFSGSVSSQGGFTGSLQGTASFALAVAGGGGAAFPYTGSARITGSLGITGSTSIIGIFQQGIAGNQATGTGSHAEGNSTVATGYASHAEGSGTTATGSYSHAEGTLSVALGASSHAEGYFYQYLDEGSPYNAYNQAIGVGSHAEGAGTIAYGEASHAEGFGGGGGAYNNANAPYSHVEGIGTTTNGTGSHAEGESTIAHGQASHAEGFSAQSYGHYSHAEGYAGVTYGAYAHAEGFQSIASGSYSHAEGYAAQAKGIASHAEGLSTVALGNYQHVQGQYNISSSAQSAFIIGNGTIFSRSNLVFASGSQFQITGSLLISGSSTITSQLTVGTSSAGSTENTLVVGLPPAGGVGEGGQILLQASGGLYTSASMIDTFQDQFRILKGTNASSTTQYFGVNLHNGQVKFDRYTGSGAFPGTEVAMLGTDASGNVLTTSLLGSTIFGNYAGGVGFTNPIVTYLPFGTTTVSGTETQRQIASPFTGLLKNVYVRTNGAAAASSFTTFTVRVNGVSTNLKINISGGQAAGLYSNTIDSASVALGAEISLQVSTSIANGPTVNQYSFGIYPS